MKTYLTLSISIGLSLVVYLLVDQVYELRIGLSLLTLIAVLWMTETFHVSVTALLVPLLAVLTGIFEVKQALSQFAHPIIYLFLGGFALASALHKQGLDSRIASLIIVLAKGRVRLAIWMIFISTAFTSMWISNTATAAMMLPLALGLLSKLNYQQNKSSYWFVLLGIAYSANIGGIGTLVGSPPNAIAAANTGISFVEWLQFGLPTVIIMFPLVIVILFWFFKPDLNFSFDSETKLEPLTVQQKLTLLVFLITVCGWLFSKPLSAWFGIQKDFDSLVALFAIIQLAVLRLISWKDLQQSADWGVLILFGGGLTLSAILQTTGASEFLGQQMIAGLEHAPLIVFLLALTGMVVMLTEVASNTASSALLIPVFIAVAQSFDMQPELIAILIAVAASCAFMLPVATPPNAIVFGSGLVPQQQMMKVGLVLNLTMTLLMASGIWFLV